MNDPTVNINAKSINPQTYVLISSDHCDAFSSDGNVKKERKKSHPPTSLRM